MGLGDWQSLGALPKLRELAGRLFFCALNAPYLTQLIKASQRHYQTYQPNFVNKPLLSSYPPDQVSSPHLTLGNFFTIFSK
jgi:hypothetical protein